MRDVERQERALERRPRGDVSPSDEPRSEQRRQRERRDERAEDVDPPPRAQGEVRAADEEGDHAHRRVDPLDGAHVRELGGDVDVRAVHRGANREEARRKARRRGRVERRALRFGELAALAPVRKPRNSAAAARYASEVAKRGSWRRRGSRLDRAPARATTPLQRSQEVGGQQILVDAAPAPGRARGGGKRGLFSGMPRARRRFRSARRATPG